MTNSRKQDALVDRVGYHLSEAMLYGRFIKYKRLTEILNSLIPQKPREVNVFIDMTQMMMPIYKFDNIQNPIGLLASMVNLPLHYRNYFNKQQIKSNIFIIFSSNDSVNNYRYIPSYDYKHKLLLESSKAAKDVIDHNMELMQTLMPYFPGIYLKRGTVEPTVIAYDLIDKFTRNGNMNAINLFITSSEYAYQLPAVLSNVILLFKKSAMSSDKSSSEDISFGVVKQNALGSYIALRNKQVVLEEVQQSWVSPFMVLNGLSCRDIKSLFSYQQSLKILKNIVYNYKTITPESIFEEASKVDKKAMLSLDEIFTRYYAIDIDYQLNLYRQMPESLATEFLSDLNDPQALYDISNLYFKEPNTIDLTKV